MAAGAARPRPGRARPAGAPVRTAHLADAALAKPLATHGLQPGRFDLLAALRRAGEPYALKPTQLMQRMLLSSGG